MKGLTKRAQPSVHCDVGLEAAIHDIRSSGSVETSLTSIVIPQTEAANNPSRLRRNGCRPILPGPGDSWCLDSGVCLRLA